MALLNLYSAIPIGWDIPLKAYSASILSRSLHKRIPIVGFSFSVFKVSSTADR